MTMNRAEFEADLRREGYELREGEIEPNLHRGSHAHEFDARLFVIEGSLTLVFGAERCTYPSGRFLQRPGRNDARRTYRG
jgi:hypothetical protein